jgi:hypothetical protein
MNRKTEILKRLIQEEVKKVLREENNLPVTITSINGKSFYFTKGSFNSPKVDGAGFIRQLKDLEATAPDGYTSAEMWVHDKETRRTPGASANIKVNQSKFSTYFK